MTPDAARVAVKVDLARGDVQRIDALTQKRRYGRTRAAYVREAVLEKLERDEAHSPGGKNGMSRR